MRHLFTQLEKDFVVENYPNHGAQFCEDKLNIPAIKIQKMEKRLVELERQL